MRCQVLLLAFMALLVCVQGQTTTTPQTVTVSSITNSPTAISGFTKFNPSLGTLNSVTVTLTITSASITAKVVNGGSVSHTVTLLNGNVELIIDVEDGSGNVLDAITSLQVTALNYVTSTSPLTATTTPVTTTISETPSVNVGTAATSTFSDDNSNYVGSGAATPLVVYATSNGGAAGACSDSGCSNDLTYGATGTVSGTVSLYYTYTATVTGDPQIVGFQGQRFQIHGTPDEHFNLISTATSSINAKFVYMANGICNYNDTECFSHPGTYIGEISLLAGNSRVRISSGPHAAGLVVYINDKLAPVKTLAKLGNETSVHVVSFNRVVVKTMYVSISAVNSDSFLNMGVDFTDQAVLAAGRLQVVIPSAAAPAEADKLLSKSYPEFTMHGLLGQTWRNVKWPHARLYQGEPADYQVSSLYSPEFLYSMYQL